MGAHHWTFSIGSSFPGPGTQQNVSRGWKGDRGVKGLCFTALGKFLAIGSLGLPGVCWAVGGLPSANDPPSVITARELLQREERKEGQTQRRDARLALNERPAGQAKCCAR